MALIKIDHVSKTYGTRDGGVVANDDVTLHVEEVGVRAVRAQRGRQDALVNQLLGLLPARMRARSWWQVRTSSGIGGGGRYLVSAQPQASVPLGN